MGLDLDELKIKLDNMLNQETADSLNEWINNKRDMNDEQIARIQVNGRIKQRTINNA
jgi:hypothetical protein